MSEQTPHGTHKTQATNARHPSPASQPSHEEGFIPPHGGYEQLHGYQKSQHHAIAQGATLGIRPPPSPALTGRNPAAWIDAPTHPAPSGRHIQFHARSHGDAMGCRMLSRWDGKSIARPIPWRCHGLSHCAPSGLRHRADCLLNKQRQSERAFRASKGQI